MNNFYKGQTRPITKPSNCTSDERNANEKIEEFICQIEKELILEDFPSPTQREKAIQSRFNKHVEGLGLLQDKDEECNSPLSNTTLLEAQEVVTETFSECLNATVENVYVFLGEIGCYPKPNEELTSCASPYYKVFYHAKGGERMIFKLVLKRDVTHNNRHFPSGTELAFSTLLPEKLPSNTLPGDEWGPEDTYERTEKVKKIEQFMIATTQLGLYDHEGLTQIFETQMNESGLPYSLSEFMDAQNLDEALEGKSLEEKLQPLIQLCDVLEYLHKNNIIHRDIKPANILCNPKYGIVKLIDFGISSLAFPEEDCSTTNDNSNRTYPLVGSLYYMSPKQAEYETSPQTDIYSFGATMYHVLTGSALFSDKDLPAFGLLAHQLGGKIEFPEHCNIAPQIQRIVLKCLGRRDSEDRFHEDFVYSSVQELKSDLIQIYSKLKRTILKEIVKRKIPKELQ